MNKMKMNPKKYLGIFGGLWVWFSLLYELIGSFKNLDTEFMFEAILSDLIVFLIICGIPSLVFFLYVGVGYKKKKDHWLLKTFIMMLTFMRIFAFVANIAFQVFFGESMGVFITGTLSYSCYAAELVAFSIGIFSGMRKPKVTGIIVAVSGIVAVAMEIVRSFIVGNNIINVIFYLLSELFLVITFAVFWFCAVPYNKTTVADIELRELYKKYEAGKINEFVYQERKKQILEKM